MESAQRHFFHPVGAQQWEAPVNTLATTFHQRTMSEFLWSAHGCTCLLYSVPLYPILKGLEGLVVDSKDTPQVRNSLHKNQDWQHRPCLARDPSLMDLPFLRSITNKWDPASGLISTKITPETTKFPKFLCRLELCMRVFTVRRIQMLGKEMNPDGGLEISLVATRATSW